MLLLVASYIAYTIELAKGYRVVMNCGPDVGESVAHLHVHLLGKRVMGCLFFFSSRRRHTRCSRDWSSDVCSSDLSRLDEFAIEGAYGRAVPGFANAGPVLASELPAAERERLRNAIAQRGMEYVGQEEIGRASCRERAESTAVDRSGRERRERTDRR